MEIITKEKRHEIYILAKEIYILEAPHTGMCVTIIKTWKGKPAFSDPIRLCGVPAFSDPIRLCGTPEFHYFANTLFPELSKIKPKKEHLGDDHYWWNITYVKVRIRKFDKIIEMTK